MLPKDAELLADIEKKYPNHWLIIEVLQKDKFQRPYIGRLLAKGPEKESILEKLKQYNCPLYVTYTGELGF